MTHLLQQAQARLREAAELPEVLQGRGLSLTDSIELELGLDEAGNLLIPIRSPIGELLGIKGRYLRPDKHKYFEIPPENKNPPWIAPDLKDCTNGLLFIEGELNAMVSWLALRGRGFGVVGLGSAFAEIPEWAGLPLGQGQPWYLYFDNDIAANKSAAVWLKTAEKARISAKRLGSLLGDMDACEYAEMCGLEALGERWLQLIRTAKNP